MTRSWLLSAAILLAALLIGNAALVRGWATPHWDAADLFGPEFALVSDHAKAGRLLLWNPWTAAGAPDFAEPELGTTSPILRLLHRPCGAHLIHLLLCAPSVDCLEV